MTVQDRDSSLFKDLFGDAAISRLFSDHARIRTMLDVEAALAKVQGRLGIIPEEAAAAIVQAAARMDVDPLALSRATGLDGVPVPGLVRALRIKVGAAHGGHVHVGATSQDIVDTAMVLASVQALEIIASRLQAIIRELALLAKRHVDSVMVGRTRFQIAAPTTFGLKAALWAAPLGRHLDRRAELLPRFKRVSLAGAVGNLAALGAKAPAVAAGLAAELGLEVASAPWHSARDMVAELAGWLALVSGSLGKIGLDVLLLAQSEVQEAWPGSCGGSSAMPHKANPVAAERLVTLARVNADRVSTLHHAQIHAQERDGSAWMSEWLSLPEMMVATGAASRIALELVQELVVDRDAMRARVEAAPGLAYAEPALLALMASMPREEAERQVASAAKAARDTGRHLLDLLAQDSAAPVDWAGLRRLDGMRAAAAACTGQILQTLEGQARSVQEG